MNQVSKPNPWIQSAAIDLIFFGYGWIPVFLAFVWVMHSFASTTHTNFIILAILLFNFLHRHITFPLVYGDPELFRARKNSYVWLPICCLALILVAVYSRPFLDFLTALSVLWTIYHTIMQKMGLLRFYSRKAGYGDHLIDKALVISWFVSLVLLMAAFPQAREQPAFDASTSRWLERHFVSMELFLPYVAVLSLALSIVVTIAYLQVEFRNRQRLHAPRNLFVLSIFLLYGTLYYDVLVGYAVFGFAHAIEYLAFVNIYSRKKYLSRPEQSSFMAWAVHRQVYAMAVFCVLLIAGFLLWQEVSTTTLNIYIVGSSFLHFLYDGWIWKVRDPNVGKPLGIQYP